MHILTNTQAELEIVFDAGYADAAVDIAIVDAHGRQVVASTPATKDDATDGRYTYELAPQADVASLTATWSGMWGGVEQSIETTVEVVASQLFALNALRSFDDKALGSDSQYPDDELAAKRDEITDFFEQVCNVSFVRRYARDVVAGEWRYHTYLLQRRPQKILAISVNGVALSDDEIAAITLYDSGKVMRSTPWPWNPVSPNNVVVEYEHGWKVPPAKIVEAAKILARYELVTNDIGDRTLSINTELGQVRLSVPGQNFPTGIPIVDAALAQYDETSDIETF